MCGIAGIVDFKEIEPDKNIDLINYRGPDNSGFYETKDKKVNFFHKRLAIIDLDKEADQPMLSNDKKLVITFNGEIYNYKELREELKQFYSFETRSDTEVILASYKVWGSKCLEKFFGMFAFAIWDEEKKILFAATDRYSVKPFCYSLEGKKFTFASEIKALCALGVEKNVNESAWADYFASGVYDNSESTFYDNIFKLEGGYCLSYSVEQGLKIIKWYDAIDRINDIDTRKDAAVEEELLFVLEDALKYRFISDVPVGVCLSGGVDSSLLVALIRRVKGNGFPLQSFTFYTNNDNYDEVKYVKELAGIYHFNDHYSLLTLEMVSERAEFLAFHMDEPYGGVPTIAMSKVYEQAHNMNMKVLLDGNGLDEGWGGYDYYRNYDKAKQRAMSLQGSTDTISLEKIMTDKFKSCVTDHSYVFRKEINDPLARIQYKDLRYTKIPRAVKFADRNSMAFSIEARVPFLDHRVVELGLRQPAERKIRDGQGKYLVRKLGDKILNKSLSFAPKRPLQTPQREWLKNELNAWAVKTAEYGLDNCPQDWFNKEEALKLVRGYKNSNHDNSFYLWQFINLGLFYLTFVLQ